MFKLTIIFGCALLATLTSAAVVNVFNPQRMVSQIDAAIKDINIQTKNFGQSVRAVNGTGRDSMYYYMKILKMSMNATLDMLKSQVADLENSQSETFRNNNCGEYLEEILEMTPTIQDAMDGCTLVAMLPSVDGFSEAFRIVAASIASLENLKALVASCRNNMCKGLNGDEPITDPSVFIRKIENYIFEKTTYTLATLRYVHSHYLGSIADTTAVLDCINKVSDYDQFVEATSQVLLETAECLATA